ncbi:MAG: type IV secretion system DNA-binding domain-containing protein [Candidatus Pacebacteria bacterium]|nr:type IV secretion system DNA-binding domain-containing protein [Candidatus Paceibacterota bacterium]
MTPLYKSYINYFAFTNFRNDGKLFGILQKDRLLHTYIIGKTGTGKTNLLTSLILQDIKHKRGVCVFDVHGDLSQTIFKNIQNDRKDDVIYLDIADPRLKYRYNPLKRVSIEKRSLVASSLIESFQKLWKGAWGVKLEHILRYIILTLLDQPKANLADIHRIIHDVGFQNQCLKNIQNPLVIRFWQTEFKKYTKNDIIPILNKVGAFLAHPSIRRFLIENPNELSLRRCMDEGKIVVVNISKGKLGSDVSNIVGSFLLNAIMGAGFSRIDTEERYRKPFHVFLDEFHNYTTPSIINMLSEIRKWKISLTLAHQYLFQLDTDIRNAVLGNVGTIICFRLGQADAKYMAHEFHPIFESADFVNLENYDIYLKLMIYGKPSRPFSASTCKFSYILTLPT